MAVWLVAALLAGIGCSAGAVEAADDVEHERVSDFELVSDRGFISVAQVGQMSVVIETPAGVVYSDPTRGGNRYSAFPQPDVILVSHEHHEHYDPDTLEALVGPDTQLVVPSYVMDRLPESLRGGAVPLGDGQRSELGGIVVEAIPAYGLDGEAQRWHPPGRGNGYIVSVDERRLYLAGSTEATPEMPEFTYIYQYDSVGTRDLLVQKINEAAIDTTVIAPEIPS